jgi:3-methyladenine DNA glycosylase AlkD
MIPTPSAEALIHQLKAIADSETLAMQSRYGIATGNSLGVSLYDVRRICKGIHDHTLALDLWNSGIHEARIMAAIVDVPTEVTRGQMDAWVAEFDSWDVCDQVTTGLFDQTPFAVEAVFDWAKREEEFVRRAAFSTIAGLSVHNKFMTNEDFTRFFPLIIEYSTDPRNFVKKAVNWALRNIGKRNAALCRKAIAIASQLKESGDRTARWIASDALRELNARITKGFK